MRLFYQSMVSLLAIGSSLVSHSQSVAINDDGSTPAASAMLDIKVSAPSKKGLLIPRMTTTQRNAITSPAKGLLVYDSTSNGFFFHNGSGWQPMASGGSSQWTTSGLNIINANTGYVGIGITPKAKFHVAPNRTVIFGADSVSNVNSSQLIFFATKGALAFRSRQDGSGEYQGDYDYPTLGYNSLSIGEAQASGLNSVAIGLVSASNHGFAHGYGGYASDYSHGSGFGFSASGFNSFVHGYFSNARGDNSVVFGEGNEANGRFSTVFGQSNTARCYGCFVIGQLADSVASSSPTAWVANDPAFIIGNGTTGVSNGFVVLKNGITGAGLTPIATSNSYGTIQAKGIASKDQLTLIQSGSSTNRWGFYSSGSLYVYYNGTVKGSFSSTDGSYTVLSDRRVKKDLQPVSTVLTQVVKLKAYRYHYSDNSADEPLSHGFMAQDVAAVLPEFVTHLKDRDGKELLGLNYNQFSVLAIKAIQEQQTVIEEQRKLIEKLSARLDALEKRMQ